jgi:hypothetical protein
MKIIIINIEPSMRELTPCLHVHVKVEHDLTNVYHLKVSGSMFSSDGKLVAKGEEMRDGDYDVSSSDYKITSSCDIQVVDMPNSQGEHFETILKFPVNSKVFEHIENLRLVNEDRAVLLNFLFKIAFIEHNFKFDSDSNTIEIKNTNQSLGKVKLFDIKQLREKQNYKIYSSEWISKYMSPLGFVKIIMFEINQSLLENVSNFTSNDINVPLFKLRIEAAISSLHKMENHIKKGEWTQVAEQLRDIQLFKSDMKRDVKILLEKSTNLPAGKAEKFTMALDHLYDVSSQFHHSVEQTGNLTPIINVNKEDAYFIYMLMLSITQLLIKKLDYMKRNSSNQS